MCSEATIRRRLAAKGFTLQKTPARHWMRAEFGVGNQVVDDRNVVVAGCYQREFDATLEQVEAFLVLA